MKMLRLAWRFKSNSDWNSLLLTTWTSINCRSSRSASPALYYSIQARLSNSFLVPINHISDVVLTTSPNGECNCNAPIKPPLLGYSLFNDCPMRLLNSILVVLGRSPLNSKPTIAEKNEGPIIEEEIISSTVYSSGGDYSNPEAKRATRRNIEMVKPKAKATGYRTEKHRKQQQTFCSDFRWWVSWYWTCKALGEKGTLAQKEMKPGGRCLNSTSFLKKVFAYKQGSVGGSGVGGGGCEGL